MTTATVIARVAPTPSTVIASFGPGGTIIDGHQTTVVVATAATGPSGTGGGGGSFPDFTGTGSPEGVITAATVGQSYVDTSEGIVYWFDGTPATNVGWAPDMRAAYPFALGDAIWADDGSHYPWMVFPLDNNGNDLVAFAWGQGTDEYPRVCFVTDPHDGWYFGDGTFNAYEDSPPNGGVAQFKAGVQGGYGFITLGAAIVNLSATHSISISSFDPAGTVDIGSAGGAPVVIHGDVDFSGAVIEHAAAAPADAALADGSFSLWLDNTPGAVFLHAKAKDSAGAVYTCSIPMTAV